MTKIPFNPDLHKQGYQAVYRDGTPAEVIYFEDGTPVSKQPDGTTAVHKKDGRYYEATDTRLDLFLTEPVKWFVDVKGYWVEYDSIDTARMTGYEIWQAKPYKKPEQ